MIYCNVARIALYTPAMNALVAKTFRQQNGWADILGIGFAGLCLLHCLATSIILAFVAAAGSVLMNPIIHEVALALAIMFGVVALGGGVKRHGLAAPAATGVLGAAIMFAALFLPHGIWEIAATMVGAVVLTVGHYMNLRAAS